MKSEIEILALGSQLKNTISISNGTDIFISEYIGDIENKETINNFQKVIKHYLEIYKVKPKVIVYDKHPGFVYKQLNLEEDLNLHYCIKYIETQHHHSHIVSCMVENKIDEKDFLFNSEELKENFEFVLKNIKDKKIVSAMVIKMGGLAEALSKMSFGNRLGFDIDNKEVDFFSLKPASILIETTEELSYKNAIYLGEVSDKFEGKVNGENINLENVESVWLNKLKPIFPYKLEEEIETYDIKNKISEKK